MRFIPLALSACVLLGSCHKSNVAGVEIDSRLTGYILPASKVLAGINLDKIKQSDFYKRHQQQLTFPQLNQLPDRIGMDPRRDLSSSLIAWDGSDVLAMVQGAFSSDQIQQHLKTAAMPSEKYNRITLYGDGKLDFAILDKSVAIAGPVLVLKKSLDQAATGAGGIPEDLKLQLARLNSGAQVWLVSSGVISLEQLSMRSDAATALSNISDYIDATAIGLTLGSGLQLDARISCISEQGSQRVHDALRGVIGLARLNTPDNQLEQLKIWDSFHVEKQGKEVHLSAELTPALADKLVAAFPSLGSRF